MAPIRRILSSRRMFIVLFFGFSSGIPPALVGSTLQAWMANEKVDLTLIGIFSLVGLPYTLKFLWAPFMDRISPRFLGRRRGWIFITQSLLVLTIAAMSFCNPSQSPAALAALAVMVAFFSASQDIAIDAYRTEVLFAEEYGAGAALATLGYRVAMLFSGGFALILSDLFPWRTVYLAMALSVGVGLIFTALIAPQPKKVEGGPQSLRDAVVEPFLDFFRRKGSVELILFTIIYKLDVVVALALMTPFFMSLGFTKTDIGTITKGFGLFAVLAGTFTGGLWMSRLGIYRSLWVFGILQGLSGVSFYILAKIGHSYPMLVITIAAENFFSGMGNAAYAAFIMSLCNPRFTATQFALLSSLMALTRTLAGTPTGWLARTVGWEMYFLIALLLAIPGLLLLTRYPKWEGVIPDSRKV